MKIKIGPILLGLAAVVAVGLFLKSFPADGVEQTWTVAGESSSYKAIRAVCDTRTGNLIYQASGIAGPISVVPGGCALPKPAQPMELVPPSPTPAAPPK